MVVQRRAVFLDRDGTLNVDSPDYIKSWGEFAWLPGVKEALRELQDAGFALVVITNQGAISKGLTTRAAAEHLHARMTAELAEAGVHLDAVYYCPHHDADACACRKPRPGLLLQAARELGLDLARSWMVGDRDRDVLAGAAAGCRALLVTADFPLPHAVRRILEEEADRPAAHPAAASGVGG
jgi:D-glycero-D-manno-heptose 1,7-bisphosphate phosphatase